MDGAGWRIAGDRPSQHCGDDHIKHAWPWINGTSVHSIRRAWRVGTTDLQSCIIKQLNMLMRATEVANKRAMGVVNTD